jgi:hypothetical protein
MDVYAEAELPEPIGTIRPTDNDYDFTISLPSEHLSQVPLVALALVVIIDLTTPR